MHTGRRGLAGHPPFPPCTAVLHASAAGRSSTHTRPTIPRAQRGIRSKLPSTRPNRDPEGSSVVPGDPTFVHGALEFFAEHIPLARCRVPRPALLHPHPA